MSANWTLHSGDCLVGISALKPNSIDSMVTDPPAGIGFMGKEWDGDKGGRTSWIAWLQSIMTEALRVLKPGAHALVWAIPRTSHWTATALEQAGFEIRDVVTHHFGTGFPKSLNLGDGLGTALKPASEHWILARKPLTGTVAANVQAHGTGALNIDACRIGTEGGGTHCTTRDAAGKCLGHKNEGQSTSGETFHGPNTDGGRWPANLVLTHSADCAQLEPALGGCAEDCPVRELDGQSGVLKSGSHKDGEITQARLNLSKGSEPTRVRSAIAASEGGASRFFYVAKPSTAEREEGLAHLPKKKGAEITDRAEGSAGIQNARAGAGRTSSGRANHHPTVKAVSLMKYLVKLVTPPGGIVLDPFTGSGTTGVAAVTLGMRFVGWEIDPEYLTIAEGRIGYAGGVT